MRTLVIAAGLFFSLCAAVLIYAALSGSGHEYELKLVLPIDARQMPKPVAPPEVVSQPGDGAQAVVTDGRAGFESSPPLHDRPPVRFEERPGSASE